MGGESACVRSRYRARTGAGNEERIGADPLLRRHREQVRERRKRSVRPCRTEVEVRIQGHTKLPAKPSLTVESVQNRRKYRRRVGLTAGRFCRFQKAAQADGSIAGRVKELSVYWYWSHPRFAMASLAVTLLMASPSAEAHRTRGLPSSLTFSFCKYEIAVRIVTHTGRVGDSRGEGRFRRATE